MRFFAAGALAALGTLAATALVQVPIEDRRNTWTPDPNTHFSMTNYSRRDWDLHRRHLRRQILSAAGLLPVAIRPAVRARSVWTTVTNGVAIESILLETMPGYYVGANLYRPEVVSGKIPAVLSPHGHFKRGRVHNDSSYSVPALGINLARQGYAVFTWDMVGYNDTRQTPHGFGGWREQLWGFNPLGLQLWNSLRAMDYVRSLRYVDPAHIAVTGASGGGTQTFLFTAVDERVRYTAPVNMISAYMQGGDPCEEAPGLRHGTFNVEFGAMAAPRPMLVVSCTGDWTRHTPSEEFPEIRRIYNLFGRPERVENFHLDAKHNYNRQSREAVYRFLAYQIMPGHQPPDLRDHDIDLPDPEQLLALRHTELPGDALDYEGVFAEWRDIARGRVADASEARLRDALRYAIGAEWPASVAGTSEGNHLVLSRPGRGDRVPGIWKPGDGAPVLVVHPDGAEAALRTPEVKELVESGRFVYAIDAFQTGPARASRNRNSDWFLCYNVTDDAARVQDILTALSFLKSQTHGRPRLMGLNGAAVWCYFAAAVAPIDVDVQVDLAGFNGTDEDYRDKFFVPGIQAAGGLDTARRLVHSRE